MSEANTAKIDTTDILQEDRTAQLDMPDLEDNKIIITDTTYMERYSKTANNEPDLTKKDNSIRFEATNIKNDGRTNYDKADTKSVMIVTDINEAISNINSINTTNYPLNGRMHKKINNIVSNSTDIKTMIDVSKSTMHVGDLMISKTNGTTSTKHYINPNTVEPITNTNFKTMWPLKEGTIVEARHTVQMENITMPYNINTAEAIESKANDSTTKYHSNIPANIQLKTDRDNFKSVSTYGIENVISRVKEFANMNQDDRVIEVIFIHPNTSPAEIRRKTYSPNPDEDYTKTAGNKITLLPDNSDVFNLLFKYKIMPVTIDSKNLVNRRGGNRTSSTVTANAPQTKRDFERTTAPKHPVSRTVSAL
ncbi:uncharacterized protein LOC118152284 [Callithrix jacchus]